VFSGAEPVKESTRKVWSEKFDVRLLEGYGVTECAPVVALNTPLFNKPGTVGQLMPGIEHRLEAVDGVDVGGRLHVRGANVMMGYLREENPGVLETLVEGWHDTGDVVDVDAEGFVKILGRAKRFAKIGGEMVSLAALEALAAEFWPGKASAAAVVKDPKKGEAIVLLTEEEGADRLELARFLKSRNASDLMAPTKIVVGKIPLLGTGKVDFSEVGRQLAA
jgi:acyl-[acyl-carrier-protein]-phospholipid O-acyltransferase/long-chain-fatty-acid--[acyl-carrier-protein] ligase